MDLGAARKLLEKGLGLLSARECGLAATKK